MHSLFHMLLRHFLWHEIRRTTRAHTRNTYRHGRAYIRSTGKGSHRIMWY